MTCQIWFCFARKRENRKVPQHFPQQHFPARVALHWSDEVRLGFYLLLKAFWMPVASMVASRTKETEDLGSNPPTGSWAFFFHFFPFLQSSQIWTFKSLLKNFWCENFKMALHCYLLNGTKTRKVRDSNPRPSTHKAWALPPTGKLWPEPKRSTCWCQTKRCGRCGRSSQKCFIIQWLILSLRATSFFFIILFSFSSNTFFYFIFLWKLKYWTNILRRSKKNKSPYFWSTCELADCRFDRPKKQLSLQN